MSRKKARGAIEEKDLRPLYDQSHQKKKGGGGRSAKEKMRTKKRGGRRLRPQKDGTFRIPEAFDPGGPLTCGGGKKGSRGIAGERCRLRNCYYTNTFRKKTGRRKEKEKRARMKKKTKKIADAMCFDLKRSGGERGGQTSGATEEKDVGG